MVMVRLGGMVVTGSLRETGRQERRAIAVLLILVTLHLATIQAVWELAGRLLPGNDFSNFEFEPVRFNFGNTEVGHVYRETKITRTTPLPNSRW